MHSLILDGGSIVLVGARVAERDVVKLRTKQFGVRIRAGPSRRYK